MINFSPGNYKGGSELCSLVLTENFRKTPQAVQAKIRMDHVLFTLRPTVFFTFLSMRTSIMLEQQQRTAASEGHIRKNIANRQRRYGMRK